MTFSFVETINNLADRLLNISFIKTIATNPIYTAIFITVIVLIVIVIIFRDADELSSLAISSSVYIFMMLLVIMFLHDKVLMMEMGNKEMNRRVNDIFDPINITGGDHDAVDIPISYDLGEIEME